MSTDEDPAEWLRQRIRERLYLAQHAIELGNAAVWAEQSSGVLVTGEPTETDVWHGTWATGDSSLTRLMEANDPRDTIARCEAELAILDEHARVPWFSEWTLTAWRAAGVPEERITAAAAMASCARCYTPVVNAREDEDQCLPVPYPCKTGRLLASGYRYRTGYGERWAATPG